MSLEEQLAQSIVLVERVRVLEEENKEMRRLLRVISIGAERWSTNLTNEVNRLLGDDTGEAA